MRWIPAIGPVTRWTPALSPVTRWTPALGPVTRWTPELGAVMTRHPELMKPHVTEMNFYRCNGLLIQLCVRICRWRATYT